MKRQKNVKTFKNTDGKGNFTCHFCKQKFKPGTNHSHIYGDVTFVVNGNMPSKIPKAHDKELVDLTLKRELTKEEKTNEQIATGKKYYESLLDNSRFAENEEKYHVLNGVRIRVN